MSHATTCFLSNQSHSVSRSCSEGHQLLLQPLDQGSLSIKLFLQLLLCCHVPLFDLLLGVGRCQGLLETFVRAVAGRPAICLLHSQQCRSALLFRSCCLKPLQGLLASALLLTSCAFAEAIHQSINNPSSNRQNSESGIGGNSGCCSC